MEFTIKSFYFLTLSLCLYNCYGNDKKTKDSTTAVVNQPQFLDGGKTVDSLIKVYNCEGIEYDNWEEKKPTDSCLTVCFINSTKVPPATDFENSIGSLEKIASVIKRSLKKPQDYKSYYIIFIKKETKNGMIFRTHSNGMKIPSTEL